MLVWLKKNREWVFSGIGVAICVTVFNLIINNQQPTKLKVNQSGKNNNNIIAGGNVTVSQNPSLTQREIDGNFPLYEHPVIDLDSPIEEQVQLFATDRVRIYSGDSFLEEVWFGLD